MKKLVSVFIISLIFLSSCSHQNPKADTVIIIENGLSYSYGKVKVSFYGDIINQWDPGNIFIIRDTTEVDFTKFKVKAGAAYIVMKGMKLKYLTDIDLSKSNEELLEEFLNDANIQ